MKNSFVRVGVLSLSMAFLAACGGGGGEEEVVTREAPPASSWSMDTYTYVNGGYSAQNLSTVGGSRYTVAAVSTATLNGGDKANGPYSGSALTITFLGAEPGLYTVVPDRTTLINSEIAANPIYIESNVGINVQTGATLYRAVTGQVKVTKDAAGVFHFDSVGKLSAAKTLDVGGGVPGAPATMELAITNAF